MFFVEHYAGKWFGCRIVYKIYSFMQFYFFTMKEHLLEIIIIISP